METPAIYAILSVLAVSLLSFVGLLTMTLRMDWAKKILTLLVSFAAGAMLGDVFIHLLPELVEGQKFTFQTSIYILATIVAFYIMEKYVHWHHHGSDDDNHTPHLVFSNLLGDGIHNIIDGVIIGAAYLLDTGLGIATTIAVIMHEIPQEFGDFGVLIYAGLSKAKALFYNFLSALTALAGVIIAIVFGENQQLLTIMGAVAIGSFIYIAIADLIPESHKQKEKFLSHLVSFLLGITFMYLLLFLE